MGTWETNILGNDITSEVYDAFIDKYNTGNKQAWVSKQIKKDFADYFADPEDHNNALFGLALAQWETKSLAPEILEEIGEIVKNGTDLAVWEALGADQKTLTARKNALQAFLEQIATQKEKAKRRVKPKFKFRAAVLFELRAPDDKKTCLVQKNYNNNKYMHTSCSLNWGDGGSGVFQFAQEDAGLKVAFVSSQEIVVAHSAGIVFQQQRTSFFYSGNKGTISYKTIN